MQCSTFNKSQASCGRKIEVQRLGEYFQNTDYQCRVPRVLKFEKISGVGFDSPFKILKKKSVNQDDSFLKTHDWQGTIDLCSCFSHILVIKNEKKKKASLNSHNFEFELTVFIYSTFRIIICIFLKCCNQCTIYHTELKALRCGTICIRLCSLTLSSCQYQVGNALSSSS